MSEIDRLWVALGTAIAKGASERQVNGIVARLNRARGRS
jgi:hypothetical protein